MSSLDYMRRKRFINALVSETKMEYKEGESHDVPNGETIVMPEYKPDFTEEQDQAFMAELIQKCYHALPDNIEDSRQNLEQDKPFTTAHNIVCRSNAQHKRQGILPGADEYLRKESENNSLRFIKALQDGAQIPPELEAVKAFDIISRSKWQSNNDFNVREHISEEAKQMLDKALSNPDLMSDYLHSREGGQSNIDMTKRLLEELTDEEQAEQMQQEAQQSNTKGQQDGKENQEGSKGESGADEGEKGEGDQETDGTSKQAVYDPDHECLDGFNVNKIGKNQDLIYPDKDFGGKFYPMENKVIVPRGDGGSVNVREDQVRRFITTGLSKKVRNVLKVYSQARYAGGKKKGKINKRAIASIATGNERIFRQKEIKDVLDTSVMLLVDTSGSMCGGRYSHATAATAMLNECLSKLNIPHAIYGFTSYYDYNKIYQHKKFGQSRSMDEVIHSMCSSDVNMVGNDDADSVLFAHDVLIQQKQKRKILIVLSDGQPTDPHGCDAPAYLKHVTNDIEQRSPVELYGIGIQTTCVKDYYKNSVVIEDCSELETQLLTVLKDSILN